MTDTDGRPLGSRYHLDCLIGRGGMGDVWRGADSEGNAFAFKLLQPQYVEDGEIVRRFLSERQLLTSVRHPNVVGVHDMVAEGATLAIVMDLIEGTDLRRHLRERGTLAAEEACRITAQIASGLAAIHAKRIVHRDIKPENTLLDHTVSPPQVRITDFGVARLMEESPAQSRRTALAGTPLYMAPEVINGQTPTPRSDLYALGIILYELLCGVTPFAGLATGPMVQAHNTMNPGRPAGIDDQLWNLIAQLVSKDPNQRPQDASVVAEQLEYLRGWLAGRPALGQLGSPPPPVPVTPPSAVTTIASAWVTPTQLAAHQTPTLGHPSWLPAPRLAAPATVLPELPATSAGAVAQHPGPARPPAGTASPRRFEWVPADADDRHHDGRSRGDAGCRGCAAHPGAPLPGPCRGREHPGAKHLGACPAFARGDPDSDRGHHDNGRCPTAGGHLDHRPGESAQDRVQPRAGRGEGRSALGRRPPGLGDRLGRHPRPEQGFLGPGGDR